MTIICVFSPQGSSVVDYIITPHVYTTTDMIDACNLAPLIGDRCKGQRCLFPGKP